MTTIESTGLNFNAVEPERSAAAFQSLKAICEQQRAALESLRESKRVGDEMYEAETTRLHGEVNALSVRSASQLLEHDLLAQQLRAREAQLEQCFARIGALGGDVAAERLSILGHT